MSTPRETTPLGARREAGSAVYRTPRTVAVLGVTGSIGRQAIEVVEESRGRLEPVLQVQNPKLLRVDSEVEIQDALELRDRLEKARRYRDAALQVVCALCGQLSDSESSIERNLAAPAEPPGDENQRRQDQCHQ